MHPRWLTHWQPPSWGNENRCLFTSCAKACLPLGSSWNKVIVHGCVIFLFFLSLPLRTPHIQLLGLLIEHLHISAVAWCVNLIYSSFSRYTWGSFIKADEKVGEEPDRLKPGLVMDVSENIGATDSRPLTFFSICIKWSVQRYLAVTDGCHVSDKGLLQF